MPELIIAEHHDQVFSVWEERGMRDLSVAHVDFHCDMRGLLIDRPTGKAIFTSERESTFVDRGNFLAHAIMKGMVTDLRWVHGPRSGRNFDIGPVVSYESDFKAPWYRFKHNRSQRKEVSLKYSECLLSDWQGLRPGEQLDLDWDALASVEYDQAHKEQLINGFLNRNFDVTPEVTFLVYSPGYSDPDLSLYEDFAKELAGKFKAQIVRLPKTKLVTDGERFSALRGIAKKVLPPQIRDAKHAVTKFIRAREAANDLGFYSR